MNHRFFLSSIALASALSGCLPAQLDKYRRADRLKPNHEAAAGNGAREAASPEGQVALARAPAAAAPPRASIYPLDKQTYRFALREGDVWDAALTVLLHNYNLTVLDRSAGIISTEWDSFFLGGAVYRNKLSLRLLRMGPNACDLTIHNNVERLRDASQAAGAVGAVWLPAPDPASEVPRIVQNMAAVLNQPPPILPPEAAIATKALPDGGQVAR